jgi:hypothetical protein
MGENGSIASVEARVNAIEPVVERLRERSHQHAQTITEHSMRLAILDEMRGDVRLLLRRQWQTTGGLALIAFIVPLLVRLLS